MYDEIKSEFYRSFRNFNHMKGMIKVNTGLNYIESAILSKVNGCEIEKEKNEIKLSDIRLFFDVTKPAISQTLNSLEKKGLIKRDISKKDRRAITLSITDKGKEALCQNKQQMNLMLDELIERFGEDNSKNLIDLLNQLSFIINDIKKGQEVKNID